MWYIKTGAHDLLIFRILAGLVLQDFNDTTLMTVTTQLTASHEDGTLKAIRAIDHQLSQLDHSARTLRSRRNALAPISTLPPEILSMVFMYMEAASNHSLAWIKVSHVCQHWRAVALDSPRLWTNIVLSRPKWTREMLKRSKMAPLDIKADLSFLTPRLLEVVRLIMEQIHRTRSLNITANHSTLNSIFAGLHDAPLLRSLNLRDSQRHGLLPTDSPSVPFAMKAPRLRHLELLQCNVEWNSPFLRPLTHFKLCDATPPPMGDLLSALQAMPYLEVLELQNSLPRPDLGLGKREVRLGKLKKISIKDPLPSCASLLGFLAFKPCTSFHLDCTFSDEPPASFFSYLKVLHQLPLKSINTLELAQDGPAYIEVYASEPASGGSPRATSFDFRLSWSQDVPVAPTEVFSSITKSLKLSLLQTLYHHRTQDSESSFWLDNFSKLPKLQNVTLSGSVVPSFLDALVHDQSHKASEPAGRRSLARIGFPSLRSLALHNANLADTVGDKRLLTTLRDVIGCRLQQGIPIIDLTFEWCANVHEADVKSLGMLVKNVRWDGQESVLNSDGEGLLFMDLA
ncbi:F-box domain-containing protein [Pleurotus pulmonarius]